MITRRSFISALSAAFATSVMAGPSLTLSSAVNWDYFTDLDAVRYDLSTPWLAHSKTLATDGRILFATNELYPLVDNTAETRKPNLDVLPWDLFDSMNGWQSSESLVRCKPVFKDKYCNEQPCGNCKGTGRVGLGVVKTRERDEFGDLYQTWAGGQPCEVCKGEVWTADSFVFKANESKFAAHYVERIKSMGDFDFVMEELPARGESNPADAMLFRNALGCGFLMSVNL